MSPKVYRLVVDGELGPRYASAFDGMTISTGGGRTEITGPIIDQSHMQGILEQVGRLGLSLHSVTPLDSGNGESDAQPATHDPDSKNGGLS
jgi:hypothetical protein